jgi:ABC-2 type transport system permease protein
MIAASRAARLVFPRLLWGTRARLVAVVLAWPVVLPVLGWVAGAGAPAREPVFAWYLSVIVPLAALVHATRLIRDDVESRTIVYLLSRPVSRPALFLGEWTAYLAAASAVSLPATVIGWRLTAGSVSSSSSFAGTLLAVALDVAAFGALFALLGIGLKRPLVVGLLFLSWEWGILLWGLFTTRLFGGLLGGPALLARLSITGYVRALTESVPGVSSAEAALVLGALTLACAFAGAVVFAAREWVPEP